MFLVVRRSDVYFDFEVHFLCARLSAQVKLLPWKVRRLEISPVLIYQTRKDGSFSWSSRARGAGDLLA